MGNEVHIGDGVIDEAKTAVNERAKKLVRSIINDLFDYLGDHAKGLPNTINDAVKELRNNPNTEKEIVEALWSEQLYKKGLLGEIYRGLPDGALIHNYHQEAYIDGLYFGYLLSMMALIDNGATKELILATRDKVFPNLYGPRAYYENRNEISERFKSDKYEWVHGSRKKKKELDVQDSSKENVLQEGDQP